MVKKETINVKNVINSDGCFDLQFRQDVKRNRLNSPIYHRWKAQFVIINSPDILEKVKSIFGCGNIHLIKSKARYSVQNIGELKDAVIPYFNSNKLVGNKKKDFDLWAEGVEIIFRNKGKIFSDWGKGDFRKLIDIQKVSIKFKNKPRNSKWIKAAQDLAGTL